MKQEIKVLYPGRFQPMGRHHYMSYLHLVKTFGADNVYVVTSDKVESPKSPFTFKQKRQIAEEYGISKKYFVKVADPYKAIELVSNFDPNTVVLFALGAKDMGDAPRFKIKDSNSYFQVYSPKIKLDSYRKHSYLYTLPHVSIAIPKYGEMSGTTLRATLAKSNVKEFTDIFGWYDRDTYLMIKQVLGNNTPVINESKGIINSITIDELIRDIHNSNSPINTRILLQCGGAGGHMQHPYDNLDLTFDDLYEIISRSLSGNLNIEKDVQEKTDGQNLQVTYKDGKLKAARNKSQIINPIDSDAIKLKFAGRGDIEKAFGLAMDDLEAAFNALSPKVLDEIFNNGTRFINLEIIYPATKNVINYGDVAYLQFHGLVEYNDAGNVVNTFPEFGKKLYGIIAKVNASVQRTFKIIPPNIIQLKRAEQLDDRLSYYKKRINSLQSMYNLTSSDTIYKWHLNFWTDFIQKYVPNLNPADIENIVKRWVYGIKSYRLDSSNIPDKNTLDTLLELESTIVPKQIKINTAKFEDIFLQLGVEVLKVVSTVLNLNPDVATKEIRASLVSTINAVIATGNVQYIDKVKEQLKRLQSIGGIKSIVPIEGIVFTYKGSTYKLTGSFAPSNQILGLLKFIK